MAHKEEQTEGKLLDLIFDVRSPIVLGEKGPDP
jgi:hypothetical protein